MRKRSSKFLPIAAFIVAASITGIPGILTSQVAGDEKSPVGQQVATKDSGEKESIKVSKGDVVKSILLTGELQAEKSTDLQVPRIRTGFASSVTFLAPEGEYVKKGERVMEFDASGLLSQKSEAERRLDEAKLKIEKTRADLEVQRADLLTSLNQAEGSFKEAALYGKIDKELLPANTFMKYQLDLEKAKLAVDKAKEQLDNFEESYKSQMALVQIDESQAELDLKKIDGDLNMLAVDAPQDGIVIYGDNWNSNRKIQVGDSLFPGQTVLQLPDLSSMHVIGYVYDTELRYIANGTRCTFGLDAVPGRRWTGTIVSVTSVVGRKGFASDDKVFRAFVKPDSVDLSVMKPGMTAQVDISVTLAKDVPIIPRNYLGMDFQGRYYVLKGSTREKAERQFVELGVVGDTVFEVTSGISVGDQILALDPGGEEMP